MIFDREVICIDRDGNENTFRYSMETTADEKNREKIVFRIVPFDLKFNDWFEFSVVKVAPNNCKVSMMSHNNLPEYVAKGIPDKMIEEAAIVLKSKITSSSTKKVFQNLYAERRSNEATKVWKRLEIAGKAKYDANSDMYTFI